jgi:hypothetical protein
VFQEAQGGGGLISTSNLTGILVSPEILKACHPWIYCSAHSLPVVKCSFDDPLTTNTFFPSTVYTSSSSSSSSSSFSSSTIPVAPTWSTGHP